VKGPSYKNYFPNTFSVGMFWLCLISKKIARKTESHIFGVAYHNVSLRMPSQAIRGIISINISSTLLFALKQKK